MKKTAKVHSSLHLLPAILLLVSLFLLSGCASRFAKYEKVDQELQGKVIYFKEPMFYEYLPETDDQLSGVEIEGAEVNRILKNEWLLYPKYKSERLPEDMTFTVTEGSYRVGNRGLAKKFNPDETHYLILRDENGLYSACGMGTFELFQSDTKE